MDFEAAWANLRLMDLVDRYSKALEENGLEGNPASALTIKDNMDAFNGVYTLCIQRNAAVARLYTKYVELKENIDSEKVLPLLTADGLQGEFLLVELKRRWAHKTALDIMFKRLFGYLDINFVRCEQKPTIGEASNISFKGNVFDKVKAAVFNALLEQINKERDGTRIDRLLLKGCTSVYSNLCDAQHKRNPDKVYLQDFEAPFVAATRAYFELKASSWRAKDSVPAYLKKVEAVLTAEADRVKECMEPSTEAKVVAACEVVLLKEQAEGFIAPGLPAMLRDDRFEDLARMYRLCARISDETKSLKLIAERVGAHFKDLGLSLMRARESAAEGGERMAEGGGGGGGGKGAGAVGGEGGGGAPKEAPDSPEFVKDMAALHEKARSLMTREFQGHVLFKKAINDAFVEVMNKSATHSKYSNAEVIGHYSDRVLRGKDRMSEAQVEQALGSVVSLFGYLSDKDVFAEVYRNLLAKRMLTAASASNDMERKMLSLLKTKFGTNLTAKMENMVNDLEAAAGTNVEFRAAAGGARPPLDDFHVQLLRGLYWPSPPAMTINLPPTLAGCVRAFEGWYKARPGTSSHKLSWSHTEGSVAVACAFSGGRHECSLNTLQAAVLLLFNEMEGAAGLTAIRDKVGCEMQTVKRVLHSLACAKFRVLKKTPDTSAIMDDHTFAYNPAFTSTSRAFKIPMPSLQEAHEPKKIEEGRIHAVEAAVVRIMKNRKTLGHQELVAEVMKQLTHFAPDVKFIKMRIGDLIGREFLARTDEGGYCAFFWKGVGDHTPAFAAAARDPSHRFLTHGNHTPAHPRCSLPGVVRPG